MSSTMMHVATAEIEVEVLDDPDDAARSRGGAVRRHRHEVELDGQVDRAGQVAHEHERALEHADEQRRPVGVVGGDLLAELVDATAQLVFADHDSTDVVVLDHSGNLARFHDEPPLGPAHHATTRELGRPGDATRDVEHALHLRARRRRRSEPAPHRPLGEDGRQRAQLGRRGAATPGHADAASSSRNCDSSRNTSDWRASTGTRSRPAIDSSSGSTSWRTATRRYAWSSFIGSDTTGSPSARAQLAGLGPTHPQQRPDDAVAVVGHAREPGGGGAAQEVEEDGLGLVVLGVPDEHDRRAHVVTRPSERVVADAPGTRLDVAARRDRTPGPSGSRRRAPRRRTAPRPRSASLPSRSP